MSGPWGLVWGAGHNRRASVHVSDDAATKRGQGDTGDIINVVAMACMTPNDVYATWWGGLSIAASLAIAPDGAHTSLGRKDAPIHARRTLIMHHMRPNLAVPHRSDGRAPVIPGLTLWYVERRHFMYR
jgi:hypothetical protein